MPVEVSYFVAFFCARIKYYFSKKDRDLIINNLLPVVNSRREAKKYSKKVFENFTYYLVDFFRFSKIDDNFIKKNVKIEGLDNLNTVTTQGKGTIVLTAHIGNYEMGGAVLAFLGYDFYALALPHKNDNINAFFNEQRRSCKVKVISTGLGLRECFKILNQKKVIAFVGDRDFNAGKREKVKMFGKIAFLPRGAAVFSLKTDAIIIPTFFLRENKYCYRFIFEPPIFPTVRGLAKTPQDIIREYSTVLEKYIAKYPGQWYVFEKYWHSSK